MTINLEKKTQWIITEFAKIKLEFRERLDSKERIIKKQNKKTKYSRGSEIKIEVFLKIYFEDYKRNDFLFMRNLLHNLFQLG